MELIHILLGTIIGLLIALIALFTSLRFKPNIDRKIAQVEAKLKPKGRVIEPENEELTDFLDNLPTE